MGKDSKIIGDQLNKDFNSLCEWFIDDKLSIHFGEEKTKSILFGTEQLLHKGKSLNIRYGDTEIITKNDLILNSTPENRL